MKRIAAISAALACCVLGPHLAGPEATQAAAVYSQVTPTAPAAAFSSNDVTDGQKVADNFVLNISEPATIRSVRFIGGYIVRNPPPTTPPLDALPTDNFRVLFFGDDGNAPGLPIVGGDFQVGTPIRREPTGGPLLNAAQIPFESALDLGAGITLDPDSMYWVSILNNPGPNHGWTWARASGLVDQRIAATFNVVTTGPWEVGDSGGMYFELSGHNVPEPTSLTNWLLVALAVLLLQLERRSYKKHCAG